MPKNSSPQKPQRLYFKSYIQAIRNSVGSNLFRNFYVHTSDKGEFDALSDGDNSCAFYVSSILTIFKKINGVHGTIVRTVEDLRASGWQEVQDPKAGDVLVWEKEKFDDGWHEHIGFYIGEGRAISTSIKEKTPIEHDMNFGETNRRVEQIFRSTNWDDKP